MAQVDEASVKRAFEAVDKDHDGRLSSMEELRQAMRLLQIPFSASHVARFLEAIGQTAAAGPKVTLNQFHAAVLTQQDRLRVAFSEMSGSADGRLTSVQARSFAAKLGVSLSHDEVQHLCQSIDRSELGHIQFEEFVSWFMTIQDLHPDGLFEAFTRNSAIGSIGIPDSEGAEALPGWITLVSGAVAGMLSRTLTAPADRIKTMLQANTPAVVAAAAAAARGGGGGGGGGVATASGPLLAVPPPPPLGAALSPSPLTATAAALEYHTGAASGAASAASATPGHGVAGAGSVRHNVGGMGAMGALSHAPRPPPASAAAAAAAAAEASAAAAAVGGPGAQWHLHPAGAHPHLSRAAGVAASTVGSGGGPYPSASGSIAPPSMPVSHGMRISAPLPAHEFLTTHGHGNMVAAGAVPPPPPAGPSAASAHAAQHGAGTGHHSVLGRVRTAVYGPGGSGGAGIGSFATGGPGGGGGRGMIPDVEIDSVIMQRRHAYLVRMGFSHAEAYHILHAGAATSAAGGGAGAGTAGIDRFALNRRMAVTAATAPLDSIAACARAIFADGGVRGFWRGNGINVMKVMPEMATRFWAYERLKIAICDDPDNITMGERFMAGASAGCLAQAAIYPMEVAKTRAALSAQGQYRSLAHCMRNCVKHEGVGALYKGLLASLVGIVPYSGVDLALYSLLKDTYAAHFPDSEPGVLTLLACGSTATTCAQLVSYPLQLVRTRLQAQGMEGRPVIYNGIVDCVAKTVNTEGIRGLYRGILPNFMKSVPAMAISYTTYEMCKRFLTLTWRGRQQMALS